MRKIILIILLVLFTNILLSNMGVNAFNGAVFDRFIAAMGAQDYVEMQQIVRNNQNDMMIIFYTLLNECTKSLKTSNEYAADAKLLGVASVIANIFVVEFPGENVLYKNIEFSDFPTANVKEKINSDGTFANFLVNCQTKIEKRKEVQTITDDLESIMNAVLETPEERVRKLEEKVEQERIAYEKENAFQSELHLLLQKRDFAGLGNLLAENKDIYERQKEIIEGMASLKDSRCIDIFVNYFDDPSLKRDIIKALCAIGGEDAAKTLLQKVVLNRDNKNLLQNALLNIGESAIPALEQELKSPASDYNKLRFIVQTLKKMNYQAKDANIALLLKIISGNLDLLTINPVKLYSIANSTENKEVQERLWFFFYTFWVVVPSILIVSIIIYWRRKWIWPQLKLITSVGEQKQFQKALSQKYPQEEAGSIIYTNWAKNCFGKSCRIKVETFYADAKDDFYDILVSTGVSVRPGTYLAFGPHKRAIKIRVQAN